ncbi:unnamed protein product [Candidula unifasciata]|uniref:Uncharacterized protein n=1 Tax=Candidula unifasciata TaxID=100452 RepID=A0A8S3ZKL2_9EUPU|nr:unnamed protein product [Candidula unifasciata]
MRSHSTTALSLCGAVVIVYIMVAVPMAQSQVLVVSSLLIPPFLSSNEYVSNGTTQITYEGYIQDLLDELAKLTGISYTFSIRADKKFGHLLRNGSWDGLIGDVVEGRVDLAAGPLTETSARSKVVDFSTPFMNFGPVIIMKRPQAPVMTLEERLQRLFSPLSQSIWMLSGLAWLITSVVLYVICYTNPYDWRRLAKDRQASLREAESFSCLNTFWFTMSNILWQGYTRSPRSIGARIVVTFWWVYVLIFVVMYIASMTNYLQVGPTQNVDQTYTSIQKLEDLGQQSEVRVGVIEGGATEQFLLTNRIPQIKHVWARIKQMKGYVSTLDKAIDKVRKSKKPYAFIAESAMAKYFTKHGPCDIYMVGDFTTIGSYSLAFPVNSSLVKRVDIALLILREKGVLKELEDRWFTGECSGFLVENNRNKLQLPHYHGVDLGSFSGALIILGIGLVLGSLVTCVEVFVFKFAETEVKEKPTTAQPQVNSEPAKKPVLVSSLEPEPITDV